MYIDVHVYISHILILYICNNTLAYLPYVFFNIITLAKGQKPKLILEQLVTIDSQTIYAIHYIITRADNYLFKNIIMVFSQSG